MGFLDRGRRVSASIKARKAVAGSGSSASIESFAEPIAPKSTLADTHSIASTTQLETTAPAPPPTNDASVDCAECAISAKSISLNLTPSSEPGGNSSPYRIVHDAKGLAEVAAATQAFELIGLDTETTGLCSRTNKVRLLSLSMESAEGKRLTFLIDCFAVDPKPLFLALAEKPLIIQNGLFDLRFLAQLGFAPNNVHDTMLLAQLLAAGTRQGCKLEDICERELGIHLDKTQQNSNWAGELSSQQLRYAATDASVLIPLYRALVKRIEEAGLKRAAEIEENCLPGMVWMANSGAPIDRDAWGVLAAAASQEADQLDKALLKAVPQKPVDKRNVSRWNWNSPDQIKQMFALNGMKLRDTKEETLVRLNQPLAQLLVQYRQAKKRSTTYGENWLQHAASNGRVYADWLQCGALTGRMSCSRPNLQNLPRDPRYRRCFVAPPGCVLVKADLSQIELRIAAKISNESRMIDAYRRGEDLHVLTAQKITGKSEVSKQERQMAKPVNFGLIFGAGTKSLREKAKADYGVELSVQQAATYRASFFKAYPAIRAWHNRIHQAQSRETRTLSGRRVLVLPDHFYGAKANYMVQGTGGDGIKVALALLWQRRHEMPNAIIALIVHDEVVAQCDEVQADAVAAWLKRALVDAMTKMLDPVPVEVEITIGRTWAGE